MRQTAVCNYYKLYQTGLLGQSFTAHTRRRASVRNLKILRFLPLFIFTAMRRSATTLNYESLNK